MTNKETKTNILNGEVINTVPNQNFFGMNSQNFHGRYEITKRRKAMLRTMIAIIMIALLATTVTPVFAADADSFSVQLADPDSVNTAALQDDAVTFAKIADQGATNGQVIRYNGTNWVAATISVNPNDIDLNEGSILVGNGSNKAAALAAGAANTVLVSDGTTVSYSLIGSANITDGSITGTDIQDGSVGSADITDNSLTSDDLGAGSVGTSEVIDNSLTSDDLGTDSVGSDEIATGAVTTTEILDGTITSTDIAAGTITGSNIATGTITSTNITDGTITGADIASGTITSTNITDGTITATDIANDTITATQIATGAITSDEILDGTITGADLSGGATASKSFFLELDGSVRNSASIGTINGTTPAIKFDQNNNSEARWTFPVPADWNTGDLGVEVIWTNGGNEAGDVVWDLDFKVYDPTGGSDITTTFTNDTFTQAAGAATVHTVNTTGSNLSVSGVAASRMVTMVLSRPTGGSDTLDASANIVGVKINYTGNRI